MSPESTSMQNAYGFVKSCLLRKLTREFSKDSKCMEIINLYNNSGEECMIETIEKLKKVFSSMGEDRESKLSACIEEFNVGLVVNMVRESKDIKLGRSLIEVANEYLSLSPEYLGFIEYDRRLDKSVNKMAGFLKDSTGVMTEMGFYDLASKLIKKIYRESMRSQSAETQKNGSTKIITGANGFIEYP